MIIKVDVTREDLRRGVPNSCEGCPVWRGLSRVVKTRPLRVGINRVDFGPWFNPVTVALPDHVTILIRRMISQRSLAQSDCNLLPADRVQPFSFELELDEDVVKGRVVE